MLKNFLACFLAFVLLLTACFRCQSDRAITKINHVNNKNYKMTLNSLAKTGTLETEYSFAVVVLEYVKQTGDSGMAYAYAKKKIERIKRYAPGYKNVQKY